MRKGKNSRKTNETDITVEIQLDCLEPSAIESGVPFFDHMIASAAKHGRFNLKLICRGDTHIDDHHSIEDIGICIGAAFKESLGDKSGIKRFSSVMIPMDDSLSTVAVDLSGRAYFHYSGCELSGYINQYSEELTLEFMKSFSSSAGLNLHIIQNYGDNRHHIHESIFKAFGIALYQAYSIDPALSGSIPSLKGTI